MRKQPPYEREVFECLQNGPLGFAQLVAATGAPNTTSLSRALKRLCRTPPRTLYTLAALSVN